MDVFFHNLYEYLKGLRNLCLCTLKDNYEDRIIDRLEKEGIAYQIHHICDDKINVYFGDRECIEIVDSFNKVCLYDLTPQEDFILGIMLGYDRLKQCERYLQKNSLKNTVQFS